MTYFDWRGKLARRELLTLERLTEGAEFVRVTGSGVVLRLADGELVEWCAEGPEYDMALEKAS